MSLDALRAASSDLRTHRNWLKGWSTTDARNPTLQGMARAAGMSPMALKREMGRVAASEERLAADVEARTAAFEKQESAIVADCASVEERHRQLSRIHTAVKANNLDRLSDADYGVFAQLQDESLDEQKQEMDAKEQEVDRRLESVWDAICEVVDAEGFTVLARSLQATPDAQKADALRRARDVVEVMG